MPSTGVKTIRLFIVKADAGTYGMGIMTVKGRQRSARPQPQAAQQDGSCQRRAASLGCAGTGRRLHLRADYEARRRTVIYMIDHFVVGVSIACNTSRGVDEN